MDPKRKPAICVFCGSSYGDDPAFRDAVAKLVSDIPEDKRGAIQQIANVTGDRNVTTQIAGSGNQVTTGRA